MDIGSFVVEIDRIPIYLRFSQGWVGSATTIGMQGKLLVLTGFGTGKICYSSHSPKFRPAGSMLYNSQVMHI